MTAVYQAIVNSPVGRVPSPAATADELFEAYNCTLTSNADQLAPERTVTSQLRPLCPWFDAEFRIIRHNCRRLERRYRRTRDSEHIRGCLPRQARRL